MAYAKAIGVRFRDSWLVKDLEQALNPYLKPGDSVLFIPAGKYRYPRNLLNIDAYYLDIDEKVLSDVDEEHKFIMDMFDAEKLGRQFDVIVSAPPYTIPYDKRFMFLRTLAKLARRIIIVKWNIIPRFGPEWELREVYIYEGRRWWTYFVEISRTSRLCDEQESTCEN